MLGKSGLDESFSRAKPGDTLVGKVYAGPKKVLFIKPSVVNEFCKIVVVYLELKSNEEL